MPHTSSMANKITSFPVEQNPNPVRGELVDLSFVVFYYALLSFKEQVNEVGTIRNPQEGNSTSEVIKKRKNLLSKMRNGSNPTHYFDGYLKKLYFNKSL